MSNTTLLSAALTCTVALVKEKYDRLNGINPADETPLAFPNTLLNKLSQTEEKFESHKKLFYFYQKAHELLSINNKRHEKASISVQTAADDNAYDAFQALIKQLHDLFISDPQLFQAQLESNPFKTLLLYFQVTDLIHHQAPLFQKQTYIALNHTLLSSYSVESQMHFEALSSNPVRTYELSNFKNSLLAIIILHEEKDKVAFLTERLDYFLTLQVDFKGPQSLLTSWLQLMLCLLVLNIIEQGIVSTQHRYALSIKAMNTFSVPVIEENSPLSTHLNIYFDLCSSAYKHKALFCLYSHKSNLFYHTLNSLSERHLMRFRMHKTPADYTFKDALGLTYSVENKVISIQKSEESAPLTPAAHYDNKMFWIMAFYLFKIASQSPEPSLVNRIIVLFEPLLLGLMTYHRYEEALDFVSFTFPILQRYQASTTVAFDISPYSRVLLLLSLLKEHHYLQTLLPATQFNQIIKQANLSSTFMHAFLNTLLHIAAVEVSNKKDLTNLLSFIAQLIEHISKDGFKNNKPYLKPLENLAHLVGSIPLIEETDVSLPLTINVKISATILRSMCTPEHLSNTTLLKHSIMKKLSEKAINTFALSPELLIPAHETLLQILNFFMPLLEVMQTTNEEKKQLSHAFKFDFLMAQKQQLALDILENEKETAKGKNSTRNKKKKLKQKEKKQKEKEKEKEENTPPTLTKKTVNDPLIIPALIQDTPLTLEIKTDDDVLPVVNECSLEQNAWVNVKRTKEKPLAKEKASLQTKISTPEKRSEKKSLPSHKKTTRQISDFLPASLTPLRPVSPLSPPSPLPLDFSHIGKAKAAPNSEPDIKLSVQMPEEEKRLDSPLGTTRHTFFKAPPIPSIHLKQLPPLLLRLSKCIEKNTQKTLVLTGSAVKSLFTQEGIINDYDCIISNMSLESLSYSIQKWAKDYDWPLTKCCVVGVKHPTLIVEFNDKGSSLKIDISGFQLAKEQTFENALLVDARKRDLISTTLYLNLTTSHTSTLPIYAPLSAFYYINNNIIDINAALDDDIKSELPLTNDFFSCDPLRMLRVVKEMLEKPEAVIGKNLVAYYPQMQNFHYQFYLWRNFLTSKSGSNQELANLSYNPQMQQSYYQYYLANHFPINCLHKTLPMKQLHTKLSTLFSRYPAEEIFTVLSRFKILEGITGLDAQISQRWAMEHFAPIQQLSSSASL